MIYGSCLGHTSPSRLPLLTPCHILVGLRNSLFSFELIRKKKKCVWGGGGEKELELVKDRLSELGKGRAGMGGRPGTPTPEYSVTCSSAFESVPSAGSWGILAQVLLALWSYFFPLFLGGFPQRMLEKGREGGTFFKTSRQNGREELANKGKRHQSLGESFRRGDRSLRSPLCCTACFPGTAPHGPLLFEVSGPALHSVFWQPACRGWHLSPAL